MSDDNYYERYNEATQLRAELYRLAVRIYYASYGRGLHGAPDAKLLRRVKCLKRMLERITVRLERTTK